MNSVLPFPNQIGAAMMKGKRNPIKLRHSQHNSQIELVIQTKMKMIRKFLSNTNKKCFSIKNNLVSEINPKP